MDTSPNSDGNRMVRSLRDPIWQGIGAIVAVFALALTLEPVILAAVPGNVRVQWLLQLTGWALLLLLGLLIAGGLVAFAVVIAWRNVYGVGSFKKRKRTYRIPRYSGKVRLGAGAVALMMFLPAVLLTVRYLLENRPDTRTVVLVADFLDPKGEDSSDVTRTLVEKISETLVGVPDIEVRPLGWAIENQRGEGNEDARRIGALENADIIIWGDYRLEPEFVTYVHFDLLNTSVQPLSLESSRVFGDEQVQEIAKVRQQVQQPASYLFNVALGEHLGALVAFAGGITLMQSGAYSTSVGLFDKASTIYGNPLARQIEPAIHNMRGTAYLMTAKDATAEEELSATLDLLRTASPDVALIPQELVFTNRGIARLGQRNYEEAISDFGEAIRLDPKHTAAYYNRGMARFSLGRLEDALADLDEAIQLEPGDADALYLRAIVNFAVGNPASAVSDFDRALELGTPADKIHPLRGLARYATSDLLGALRDYDKAITLNPNDAPTYTNRGVVYGVMGNIAAALRDYDNAIEVDPGYASAYYNRGIAHREMGDLAGSIRELDRAITLNPDYLSAYIQRGLLHAQVGNYGSAANDYDRAIELDPDDAGLHINRGNARYLAGNIKGSFSDFDEAIRLAPESAVAYRNRGLAYANQGDLVRAVSDLQRYVELAPDGAERGEILKRLSHLRAQIEGGS